MKKRNLFFCSAIIMAILFLIIHSGHVIASVISGIDLCLKSVIPALFPLMILTSILSSLLSQDPAIIKTFGKVLGYSPVTAKYFLLGILGGYPTGAIHIANAVKNRELTTREGNILLMFCSNCGPSFVFGVGCVLFRTPHIPMLIWIIHILSAYILSIYLPDSACQNVNSNLIVFSLSKQIKRAIENMAMVCCWIILFQIITDSIYRIAGGIWNHSVFSLFLGIVEISRGSLSLTCLESEMLKVFMFSLYVNTGGLCVAMQTYTATAGLRFSKYIIGKILQSAISILMVLTIFPFLLKTESVPVYAYSSAFLLLPIILGRKLKKTVAFTTGIPYNETIQKG